MVCAEFPIELKFHFSPMVNIFFPIRQKILKFEEVMEYLIRYVKFEMRAASFYVNDLSYFQQ